MSYITKDDLPTLSKGTRKRGVVRYWNPEKGFGYIKTDAWHESVYLPAANIQAGSKGLKTGDTVTFTMSAHLALGGRPTAYNVALEGQEAASEQAPAIRKQDIKAGHEARMAELKKRMWGK